MSTITDAPLDWLHHLQAVNDIISPREPKASSSRRPARRQRSASSSKGRQESIELGDSPKTSRGRGLGEMKERQTKRKVVKSSKGSRDGAVAKQGRIASFVGPAHAPDVLCAFCQGTQTKNAATGLPEVLISCVECGSSGECKDTSGTMTRRELTPFFGCFQAIRAA